eukprot:m.155072 g.155072  ORF g.155072 m.155072 type:complete len:1625 (-) comp17927_c0_seq1:94-4968(-)
MPAQAQFRRVQLLSRESGLEDEEYIKTDLNPQYDYSTSFQDASAFDSCGGGYTYSAGDTDERTRNRVIYWRCLGSILEIREISLDLELRGNGTKYAFEAAIVPNSVCFQEEEVTSGGGSNRCICINLVLADGTLYRRGFLHPQVLDHSRNGYLESVLMHPHMSWSMATETTPSSVTGTHDTFVIASSDGNVSAYVLPSLTSHSDSTSDHEWILLKSVNVVSRLLTGLTPQFLRSGGIANQIVASGSAHCKRSRRMLACTLSASLDFEAYVVTPGRPRQHQSSKPMSLSSYTNAGSRAIDGGFSSGALSLDADRHVVRVCHAGVDTWNVAVYVSAGAQSVVLVLRVSWPRSSSYPTVQHVVSQHMTADNVVNMHVATDHVWVVTSDSTDSGGTTTGNHLNGEAEDRESLVPNKVLHMSLRGGSGPPVAAVPALTTDDVHAVLPVPETSDPRAVYCAYIFNGKRFSRSVIANALRLYAGEHTGDGGREALQADVTVAVEDKIRASGLSFVAEDLRAHEMQHWHEFLRSCTHFWRQERSALGMFEDASTGFAFVLNNHGIDLLRPCAPLEHTITALASTLWDDTTAGDGNPDLHGDAEASAATVRLDIRRVLDCMQVADVVLGDTMSRGMFDSPRQFFEEAAANVVQQVEAEELGAGIRDDVTHMVAVLAPIAHPQQAFGCVLEGAYGVYPRDGTREFPMDADADDIDWEVRTHMLGAVEGVGLVAEGLSHYVGTRLRTMRNLIMTISLTRRLRSHAPLGENARAAMSDILPAACAYFQTLYVLNWIATTESSSVTQASVEAAMRHLSIIGTTMEYQPQQITDHTTHPTVLELFVAESDTLDVLRARTNNVGEYGAEEDVDVDMDGDDVAGVVPPVRGGTRWSRVLDQMVHALLAEVRGPDAHDVRAPNLRFCKFLLHKCQLEQLQEYLNLLGRSSGPGAFLMGQIQLRNGDMHKAKSNFLRAVSAVGYVDDDALWSLLPEAQENMQLASRDRHHESLHKAHYYHQVMVFFKECIPRHLAAMDERVRPSMYRRLHAPCIVIEFARIALHQFSDSGTAHDNSVRPMVAMLWTNIFQATIDLGRNDEAFTAVVSNPDEEHRRDNLQRLISVLCERGHYRDVVSFPYNGLQADALEILRTKAKITDVLSVIFGNAPNYYDVLYAFHVHKSDFHAAGLVMFELAVRLDHEVSRFSEKQAVTILGTQRDAYLVALNSLRVLDEEHAWFVRPHVAVASAKRKRGVEAMDDDGAINGSGGAFDGGASAASAVVATASHAALDVVTVADLEKESAMVGVRLTLLALSSAASDLGRTLGPTSAKAGSNTNAQRLLSKGLSPADAIAMLVAEGLFDHAFDIAKLFRRELDSGALRNVFETLSDACARLTIDSSSTQTHSNPLGWLRCNDVDPGAAAPPPLGGGDPLDTRNTVSGAVVDTQPADAAWEYLRQLLRLYDSGPENNYMYHIAVADHIMSLKVGSEAHEDDPSGAMTSYVPVPKWLLRSLKKRHPAALLRLLIKHGDLDAAVELALEMVSGAHRQISHHVQRADPTQIPGTRFLGDTAEMLAARRTADVFDSMAFWIPYTEMEQLQSSLAEKEAAHRHSAVGKRMAELKANLAQAFAGYHEDLKQYQEQRV